MKIARLVKNGGKEFMSINIVAKGFDLKQGTYDGIKSELNSFEHTFNFKASYNVTLKKKEYDEYECRINTRINSRDISVKVTRNSIRKSIEAAVKAIKDIVIINNNKIMSSKRNDNSDKSLVEETSHNNDHANVTKTKDVHLTPVSDSPFYLLC